MYSKQEMPTDWLQRNFLWQELRCAQHIRLIVISTNVTCSPQDHRLSKDLALLLTQIENAEVENAKAQHVKEAERIKRLLEEAETLREEANQAQKSESWDQALEKLAKALSACKSAAGSSNEKDDPSSKCSQDVEKDVTAVHGARKSAEAAKAAEEREALLQAAVEEEAIRQRKEQEESERIEKERQENERLAKEQEEARKLASEQAEAQRLAKAQADKAAKADADKAAIAREEAEKTASQTGSYCHFPRAVSEFYRCNHWVVFTSFHLMTCHRHTQTSQPPCFVTHLVFECVRACVSTQLHWHKS
mmetsp:Transcript_76847/g.207363  ORF Transcript_76847/g.207363 Transcript_76847/m.207363 type:complete len:306 (+) Transcript_76847:3675-4592(+)